MASASLLVLFGRQHSGPGGARERLFEWRATEGVEQAARIWLSDEEVRMRHSQASAQGKLVQKKTFAFKLNCIASLAAYLKRCTTC
jgi:hypothetical protein